MKDREVNRIINKRNHRLILNHDNFRLLNQSHNASVPPAEKKIRGVDIYIDLTTLGVRKENEELKGANINQVVINIAAFGFFLDKTKIPKGIVNNSQK